MQALASSQPHCMFCFGTIHARGYQHGDLRESPWPQQWEHDFEGFVLTRAAQIGEKRIGFENHAVLKVTTTLGSAKPAMYYVSEVPRER